MLVVVEMASGSRGGRLLVGLAAVLAFLAVAPAVPTLSEEQGYPPGEPISGIYYPRIVAPAIVAPGSSFQAWVSGEGITPSSAVLVPTSPLAGEVELQIGGVESRGGLTRVTLSVPEDAALGLYGLRLETPSGTLSEPRSVAVVNQSKGSLLVAQITDSHMSFQGIRRRAIGTFLRSLQAAEAMGADVILLTGDILDANAARPEYEWFRNLLSEEGPDVPILFVLGNSEDYRERKKPLNLIYLTPRNYTARYGPVEFFVWNTDTGKPDEVQPGWRDWLDSVTAASDAPTKVILQHYPFVSEDFGPRDDELDICGRNGVDAIITGHWHSEFLLTNQSPILVVTVATEPFARKVPGGGRRYVGFRIMRMDAEGVHLEPDPVNAPGFDASIPLANLSYEYLSDALGSSPAVRISVRNGLIFPLTFRPTFLLRGIGSPLEVSGHPAEMSYLEAPDGTLVVSLNFTAEPGEAFNITVSPEGYSDDSPPELSLQGPSEFKPGEKNVVLIDVSDVGLGVSEVRVQASADNRTWTDVEVEKLYFYKGRGRYMAMVPAPEGSSGMYVRATAEDAAGNSAEASAVLGSPSAPAPAQPARTQGQGGVDLIPVVAVAAVLAAALVVALARRR